MLIIDNSNLCNGLGRQYPIANDMKNTNAKLMKKFQ